MISESWSPIPLTPFEWSMLDEVAQFQNSFCFQLNWTGNFDPVAFRDSVEQSIKPQTLLQANLEMGTGFRRCRWVPAIDPTVTIKIHDQPPEIDYDFDLTRQIGFRAYVDHRPGQTAWYLVFHHACCDGLGALQFIRQILADYHQRVSTGIVKPAVVDSTALRYREPGLDGQLPAGRSRFFRNWLIVPYRVTRLLFRHPRTISSNALPATRNHREIVQFSLDEATTSRISKVAGDLETTGNQLLLRDLFLAIEKIGFGFKFQRVMIPVSLRTAMHSDMPAANCVSMVSVEAGQAVLRDPEKLLCDIGNQMRFIKDWGIAYSWSQSLRFLTAIPFVGSALNRRRRPMVTTTVFSNLGRVLENSATPTSDRRTVAGDMVLDSIVAAPPASPHATITFSAAFYANRLTLSMDFFSQRVSRSDAKKVLDQWVQQIRRSLDPGSSNATRFNNKSSQF